MTRKDYKMIADSFGFAIGLEATAEDKETRFARMWAIETAINSLTNKLQEDNARFDKQKFRFAIDQKAKEVESSIKSAIEFVELKKANA